MARVPTEEITEERLARWKKRLSEAHATPVVLVAIGHDEHKGRPVICTTEDIKDSDLAHLLLYAAKELHE